MMRRGPQGPRFVLGGFPRWGSRGTKCFTSRGSRAKVSELDLTDVVPTAHPLDLVNVWSEDDPRPCLPVDEALANAPEREAGFFKVPPA
jgi:Glu-tRNAGln amidotransferase C subunit